MSEILEKQSVQCFNRIYHCAWIGKLSELEHHRNNDCSRQIVRCPHIGCDDSVFREDLERHRSTCEWRIVSCADCQILIAFIDVKTHQEECPRFKVCCPQECHSMVERQEIMLHVQEKCVNTVIDCPYKDIGCETRITKRELDHYLTVHTNRHNLLLISYFKEFSSQIVNKVKEVETSSSTALANFEERVKKVETLKTFICKDSQLKENTNRENSVNANVTTTTLVSKRTINNEGSPKKDKSGSQSKSSVCSVTNATISNGSPKADKLMNRKRQRVEEDNTSININKEKTINISEVEEKEITMVEPINSSPLYSLQVSSTDGLKKKENIFDSVSISKGVLISQTKVLCQPTGKVEHKYVFANMTLNNEKEVEWRTILNVSSSWAAVGVCIKEQVIVNKYRFVTNNLQFNNATFAISTNGYSWNCNVYTENNFSLSNFPTVSKGDIIIFKYNSEAKELHYKIPNKFSGKLTNVFAPKGGSLVPCIVLLNPGDEILLETM